MTLNINQSLKIYGDEPVLNHAIIKHGVRVEVEFDYDQKSELLICSRLVKNSQKIDNWYSEKYYGSSWEDVIDPPEIQPDNNNPVDDYVYYGVSKYDFV